MHAATLVLVVVALLGLSFSSTRSIGLLSTATLCFLYPVPVALALIGGGAIFYFCKK
jgi:hypothetical protein